MRMKLLAVLTATALVAGCGPSLSYKVQVDHTVNDEADLSGYRTYGWVPLSETVNVAGADINTLTSMKIAFTDALEEKGYERAGDNPEMLVALYVARRQKILSAEWGLNYSIHPTVWDGYWMERRVSVREMEEGSIVLDIIDAESGLVWSGTAQALLKPGASGEERNRRIDEAVAKLLERLPSRQ